MPIAPFQPSISDLAQMQFLAPGQFAQAQQQLDTGNQGAQTNNQISDAELQADILKNNYNQLANPIALQQAGANLTSTQNANTISGVNADNASANADVSKAAQRQAALAKMSEDELSQFSSQAQSDMMKYAPGGDNPNPQLYQQAKNKIDASQAYLTQRQQAQDKLDQDNAIGGFRVQAAAMTGNSRVDVANILANQRDKDVQLKLQQVSQMGPKTTDAYIAKIEGQLATETDPVMQDKLQQTLKGLVQIKAAIAQGPQVGQIDQGAATGMPVRGLPDIPGLPSLATPGGPPVAPGGVAIPPVNRTYTGPVIPPGPDSPPPTPQSSASDTAAIAQVLANGAKPPPLAGPATVPQAPAGRTLIYKDGKPFGFVKSDQVAAAQAQGFTLK